MSQDVFVLFKRGIRVRPTRHYSGRDKRFCIIRFAIEHFRFSRENFRDFLLFGILFVSSSKRICRPLFSTTQYYSRFHHRRMIFFYANQIGSYNWNSDSFLQYRIDVFIETKRDGIRKQSLGFSIKKKKKKCLLFFFIYELNTFYLNFSSANLKNVVIYTHEYIKINNYCWNIFTVRIIRVH